MSTLAHLSGIARSPGDPVVLQSGPSSLTASDRLAHFLGWFSFGLGAAELLAPGFFTRTLGLEGKEWLVRAYGVREIAAGVPTLSVDKHIGLISRIAGDVMDLATLAPALREDNPKRENAMIAVAAVGLVTVLDIVATAGVFASHSRPAGRSYDYSNRSGLPRGAQASRGIARAEFRTPPDMQAEHSDPA